MFVQDNVYIPEEYGTRECPEDREPCGAFYGIPFSGEIEEMAQYDRQQIFESMPTRWFSEKDERVLAIMRGEVERTDEEKEQERMCAQAAAERHRSQNTGTLTEYEKDQIERSFIDTFVEHRAQFRGKYTLSEYLKIRWKQYELSARGVAPVI